MSEQQSDWMEDKVRDAVRDFRYPPTPDIAGMVSARLAQRASWPLVRARIAWAALIALFLAVLLLIPSVRASVFDTIRIGAFHLVFGTPPTPSPSPIVPSASPTIVPPATATAASPVPSPGPTPFRHLAGLTTLENARARAGFSIRLPTYPPDLGLPDQVFLQRLGGTYVVLVWLDPAHPDQARLVLHILGPDVFAEKLQPRIVGETMVHGMPALWTEGPYMLEFLVNGQVEPGSTQLIQGHSLIWTAGNLTYKLESGLSMPDAVRVAESIQ